MQAIGQRVDKTLTHGATLQMPLQVQFVVPK
jgi:hypothetical protein